MSFLYVGLLTVSLLLNVVFFTMVFRRTGPAEVDHMHTWTPWTDFARMEPPLWSGSGSVYFRRVRYCTACGQEQMQDVGRHACAAISRGKSCPHTEDYTAIFDPLYDLKQIDKELKDLEGM
jgi:hypothetical protein